MNLARAVSNDNVVYLATYKLVSRERAGRKWAYIQYKNKLFYMSELDLAAEKSAVLAQLQASPNDLNMRLNLQAIEEIENG